MLICEKIFRGKTIKKDIAKEKIDKKGELFGNIKKKLYLCSRF